jgi:hypothetical protein
MVATQASPQGQWCHRLTPIIHPTAARTSVTTRRRSARLCATPAHYREMAEDTSLLRPHQRSPRSCSQLALGSGKTFHKTRQRILLISAAADARAIATLKFSTCQLKNCDETQTMLRSSDIECPGAVGASLTQRPSPLLLRQISRLGRTIGFSLPAADPGMLA